MTGGIAHLIVHVGKDAQCNARIDTFDTIASRKRPASGDKQPAQNKSIAPGDTLCRKWTIALVVFIFLWFQSLIGNIEL